VLAPNTITGTRVVAAPRSLDACISALPQTMSALRFADDEVFLVGKGQIELDDEHAIVEREVGFSAFRFSPLQFGELVAHRLEWTLPTTRPALAQGRLMAIPVKIWLTDTEVLLICATAFVHELADRLR
jgi:hypothetical protein